jgi:hypothetical protein
MTEYKIIELFCLICDFNRRFEAMSSQKEIGYKKTGKRNKKSRTSQIFLEEFLHMIRLAE